MTSEVCAPKRPSDDSVRTGLYGEGQLTGSSHPAQLPHHPLHIHRHPRLRRTDRPKQHRRRSQIVRQRRRRRRTPIEPVQELRGDRLVSLPDHLARWRLARLQRPRHDPFLDPRDAIPVEHRRAALTLDPVILAVPGVGLAGFKVVAFLTVETSVRRRRQAGSRCSKNQTQVIRTLRGHRRNARFPEDRANPRLP